MHLVYELFEGIGLVIEDGYGRAPIRAKQVPEDVMVTVTERMADDEDFGMAGKLLQFLEQPLVAYEGVEPVPLVGFLEYRPGR